MDVMETVCVQAHPTATTKRAPLYASCRCVIEWPYFIGALFGRTRLDKNGRAQPMTHSRMWAKSEHRMSV